MITFSCPHCGQQYEMDEDSPIKEAIQCQVCGETFQPPVPDEKEKLLLKPKIAIRKPVPETPSAPACGSEPESGTEFERPEIADPYAGYGSLAGPWTRWGARLIDLTTDSFVVALVCGILEAMEIIPVLPSAIETAFSIAAAFLLDSFIYAVFKGTLGKWLMGERIINANMEKIGEVEYFIRNIKVFFFGFGAEIPIVTLIVGVLQYNRVSKGEPASYDEKPGFSVVEYNKRWYKTLIGVLIILAILAANIIGSTASRR